MTTRFTRFNPQLSIHAHTWGSCAQTCQTCTDTPGTPEPRKPADPRRPTAPPAWFPPPPRAHDRAPTTAPRVDVHYGPQTHARAHVRDRHNRHYRPAARRSRGPHVYARRRETGRCSDEGRHEDVAARGRDRGLDYRCPLLAVLRRPPAEALIASADVLGPARWGGGVAGGLRPSASPALARGAEPVTAARGLAGRCVAPAHGP